VKLGFMKRVEAQFVWQKKPNGASIIAAEWVGASGSQYNRSCRNNMIIAQGTTVAKKARAAPDFALARI
jgi:hypothetical protein